jgi:VCBS repeat-containing protein
MSCATLGVAPSPRLRRSPVALLLVVIGLVVAQTVGHAQVPDALPFSRNYLITGNYVVGGVDLAPASGGSGFLTGTINMSGVPANADILGAFLYWEMITTDISQANGAQFRGSVLQNVKASSQMLTPATAQCWSSGGGSGAVYTMTMFTADVLHLLPTQLDVNGNPAGRRLVNDADLAKYGYAPHTVTLPEAGTGNQVPQAAGASLFVIYRDPTKPLTSISVYEGIYIQTPGATMSQTIRGFLQSSTSQDARMTHLVGSGAKNSTDRVWFNNGRTPPTLLATDAFVGTNNASSDRAWANPTFVVPSNSSQSSLMPGSFFNDGYGETVTTTVDHITTNPYDCLSWAAIIFSTAVPDLDRDGNPDIVENSSTDPSGLPWKNPSGQLLPNLHAMGASSAHPDLFAEIGWMKTDGYIAGQGEVPSHDHRPTPAALKMVGDAFWTHGIQVHFDVGNAFPTYSAPDAYAERYIIRDTPDAAGLARGGESLTETACVADTQSPPRWICQFPDYPGTVVWKSGYLALRGGIVHDDGTEIDPNNPADAAFLTSCQAPGSNCRRRFDPVRHNFFHYVLFAHSRGIPKSPLPCLDSGGKPAGPDANGACTAPLTDNPDFHVPRTSGGRGDLPAGGDSAVTLGWWDNFVGTDFNQASTLMHELGHNLGLWHGGAPWQLTETGTAPNTRVNVYFEPNCKSNYLSLMNYAFGFAGLLDDDGVSHVDFSGGILGDLDETNLSDGALVGTPQYRTAWFTPTDANNPAKAKKFCGDQPFPNPLPAGWIDMARVDAQTVAEVIDWNRNGSTLDSHFAQDINFSGALNGTFSVPPTPPLHGFSDWDSVRLDQVGSRGNRAGFSSEGGELDLSGGELDLAGGELDLSGGELDLAGGELDLAGGELDLAGGELDLAGGDHDLTYAAAANMGYASPNTLKACVLGSDCVASPPPNHRTNATWNVPVVGSDKVTLYTGYRTTGDKFSTTSKVSVGTSSTTSLTDPEELPNGVKFTYSVTATFVDGTVSDYSVSRHSTITAVNDAPVVVPRNYAMLWNSTLNVAAATGVLAGATDDDSPLTSVQAVLNTQASHGTATVNPDGSFTYKPFKNFVGTDTFSFKANDGVWSHDATKVMSPDSNVATVTIVVTKK